MKKRKLSGERNEFFKYFMRNAAGLNWGRRGKHKVDDEMRIQFTN